MSSAPLKYTDTTDRAFGLSGMATAMYLYDAEKYLSSLSLEAEPDMGLVLTPDFYVVSNPNLSAKNIWKSSLRHFQMASVVAVGNLLSRSACRRRSPVSSQVRNLLLERLSQEGAETCGLEEHEVEDLIDDIFNSLGRVFSHPAVSEAVSSMADALERQRNLQRDEILSFLIPLGTLF